MRRDVSIVSRDVIFDETESKSAEEIENLLQKLETKGSKRKGKMQSQPTSPNWYELDFPSSKDESSVHLHQQHQLGLLAVHPHLQAATVLLTVILYILHLNDEH